MPSPFPGMDPYLEGDLWTGFHALFATQIVRDLNAILGPTYVALAQQRFVMAIPGEVTVAMADIYPDIGISHRGRKKRTGRVTAVLTAPLQVDTLMPARLPHTWVKILDVARRRLVAVIEIPSPTNKRGAERQRYLRKRQRILLSSAHLLEIDLLRKGKRVPMRTPLPAADYFVFLSRAADRPRVDVWPITLDQSLPSVPVPLFGDDPDVILNLQRVFAAVYDEGRYQALVDYTRAADVPLATETAAWLKKQRKKR